MINVFSENIIFCSVQQVSIEITRWVKFVCLCWRGTCTKYKLVVIFILLILFTFHSVYASSGRRNQKCVSTRTQVVVSKRKVVKKSRVEMILIFSMFFKNDNLPLSRKRKIKNIQDLSRSIALGPISVILEYLLFTEFLTYEGKYFFLQVVAHINCRFLRMFPHKNDRHIAFKSNHKKSKISHLFTKSISIFFR